MSKTGVRAICHDCEKDDLALENKGCGKNLKNKSGILKVVSARYKTKKAAWILGNFFGGGADFESGCHNFGVM